MSKSITRLFQNKPLFVVIILIAAFGAARLMIDASMHGTEDNLLFYLMGLNLVAPDQLYALNQKAIDYFTAQGASPHALYRLEFRRDYLNEFALPGSIYLAVSHFFKGLFVDAPGLYPLYLGQSLVMGLSLAVVISIVCTTAMIASIRRSGFLPAYGVMICLFAASELLPTTGHSFATLFISETMLGTAKHVVELLIRPGAQFSPMGFPPRSHFALFMVAVFALRWRGRIDLGYLLLFVMSFIHLSTSGLILLALLVIDLFIRPTELRRPIAVVSIVIAASLFGYRQSMWHLIGDLGWYVLTAIAVIMGLALLAKFLNPVRRILLSLLAPLLRLRTFLTERNTITSDLMLLTGGWLITFIALWAVFVIANPFDKLSGFYFWSRLHGRVMMVLWPSIIFGSLLLGYYRLSRSGAKRRILKTAIPVACLLLTLPVAFTAWNSWQNTSVMKRVVADLFRAEKRLAQGPLTGLEAMGPGELVLYYAITRTVDSGKNHMVLLFR